MSFFPNKLNHLIVLVIDSVICYDLQAGLSMKRPFTIGNAVENQEQPSPISVLEPPFSEDDYTHLELSSYIKPGNHGNYTRPTYARIN